MNVQQLNNEPEINEEVAEHELNFKKMLIFLCGEQHFAIDIMSVREIIKPVVLTRLPNVPKFVYGITNLRGNIIPILHLGFRLSEQDVVISKNMRYIVVEGRGKMFGLMVDSIKQVASVNDTDFQEPDHYLSDISQECIESYFSMADTIVIQLNVDELISEDVI